MASKHKEEAAAKSLAEAVSRRRRIEAALAHPHAAEALGQVREGRQRVVLPQVVIWSRELLEAEEEEQKAKATFSEVRQARKKK